METSAETRMLARDVAGSPRISRRRAPHRHRARQGRRLRGGADLRPSVGAVARQTAPARGDFAVPQRARHRRLADAVARLLPHQPGGGRSRHPGQEPRRAGGRDVSGRRAGARLRGPAPGRPPRRRRSRRASHAAADSLSDLHDPTRGMRVRLLLEITAGQGSCLGCRFEEMEAMLARARGGDERRHLLRHLPRPRLRLRPQHRGGLRADVRRPSRA